MKILFINPSLRGGIKGSHLSLPVGLGYVMTYVKKYGYNFDLLDIDAGGYDDKYIENYSLSDVVARLLAIRKIIKAIKANRTARRRKRP